MPRLVYHAMSVEFLALIVTSPEIRVHLGPFEDIISDELGAGCDISRFHDECPDILGSSLIEAEDPHIAFNASFGMMSELGLVDLHGPPKVTQLVCPIIVLIVLMNELADPLVEIVHILIVKRWDPELLHISESLQGIKASREVVEDDSSCLHEGQAVVIEDGALADAHLHVSALQARTLKNQAILHFGVDIHDSHYLFAAWAISGLGQHTLVNHPSEAAFEVLGHAVHFDIFLKGKLYKVSLD